MTQDISFFVFTALYGAVFLFWFNSKSSPSSKAFGCILYILIGWFWSLAGTWKLLGGDRVNYGRLDFPLFHLFFLFFWLLYKLIALYSKPGVFIPIALVLIAVAVPLWDHHLMPVCLQFHTWIQFPLFPLSLSLMLARALFHIHPPTHERLRLWFLRSVYCRYLDRCIASDRKRRVPLIRMTRLVKAVSRSPLAPQVLKNPGQLYRRYLAYLERRLQQLIAECHHCAAPALPDRKLSRDTVDTCIALAQYYRILDRNGCRTGQNEPELQQLAYLDLSLYFARGPGRESIGKASLYALNKILVTPEKTAVHRDRGVNGLMYKDRLDSFSPPVSDREWLTVYRILVRRLMHLRQTGEGKERNDLYLQLNREVRQFLKQLPLPETGLEFSAASDIAAPDTSAPQPGMENHRIDYFLSSWAGFLIEYHGHVDPVIMRTLLAPAVSRRRGPHALHLQSLLAAYTGNVAQSLYSSEDGQPETVLSRYLETLRAVHAYFGRSTAESLSGHPVPKTDLFPAGGYHE